MPKQSQRWKQLERDTAEALGGRRVVRGGDFSVSDVDVIVEDLPHLKVDCKAYAKFAHHTLVDEIRERYCKAESDEPVLVTKGSRQTGANVTISLAHFSELLRVYRQWRETCKQQAEL